jgi:hypothetical protein
LLGPDGEAVRTPVTIGLQGDAGTEITAGLNDGDVLVIPSADDVLPRWWRAGLGP